MEWSSKERLILLSNLLEFGEQTESWTRIARAFQTKKDTRYSTKSCEEEYRRLVERYKSAWLDEQASSSLKTPLAKFIWRQLKSIYKNDLLLQLKESRKKLTEVCLRFESAIQIKSQRTDNINISSNTDGGTSTVEQTTPISWNELKATEEEHLPPPPLEIPPVTVETTNVVVVPLPPPSIVFDLCPVKEEPTIESYPNPPIPEEPIVDTPAELEGENGPSSSESSRSTSRTNSETKTDPIKTPINSSSSTPKYHVYFSPKNAPTVVAKSKAKKRPTEETKGDEEPDSEPSKVTPSPMTRRSINTRSVPNTVAEQEEEKSRRFSAMVAENPLSWQSQANAIIQYLLSQKQGYLFEHEITDEIAPKYHLFIRRPVALDSIRHRLESNEYPSGDFFKRDVFLMLYNAMKYNPRFHHVHRSAKSLFQQALPLFNLSAEEIHGQIPRRTSISSVSTSHNPSDTPAAKRKRIK